MSALYTTHGIFVTSSHNQSKEMTPGTVLQFDQNSPVFSVIICKVLVHKIQQRECEVLESHITICMRWENTKGISLCVLSNWQNF